MMAAILFDDTIQIALLAALAAIFLWPIVFILRTRRVPVAVRSRWALTALLVPPAAYALITLELFDPIALRFDSVLAEFQASLLLLLLASCAPWFILARFRRRYPPQQE